MIRRRLRENVLLTGQGVGTPSSNKKLQERNMSYCRFENTYYDLRDCYDNWYGDGDPDIDGNDLSASELKYRKKLFELCQDIIECYEEDYDEGGF